MATTPILPPFAIPWTILIDSAEQHPWTFKNLRGDANRKFRPLTVSTQYRALGRHPLSFGDYSVDGYEKRVCVERKSTEDLQGTLLGWEKVVDGEVISYGRRSRFEAELENLSLVECGAVIVEGSLLQTATQVPNYGSKTPETVAKIIYRSIIAMQMDYARVRWFFCDTRELAEATCFRLFERFIRHDQKKRKQN